MQIITWTVSQNLEFLDFLVVDVDKDNVFDYSVKVKKNDRNKNMKPGEIIQKIKVVDKKISSHLKPIYL